jgi:hypothetical protein
MTREPCQIRDHRPDLIKRIDAALARAKQLDLDREQKLTKGTEFAPWKRDGIFIPLRPTTGNSNG